VADFTHVAAWRAASTNKRTALAPKALDMAL